ncbi:uncharacterized protein K444DRAFT_629594 [Hyaloscypha bicolor E]|uniref:Tc toxin complex TcA C-terminal TcB-binding domain-containing protein n=1 Tax=Hyaloscypha bicolor E TaxID=1095630 RepID=A0A2J6TAX2_9HELO|nr:uncharacterized protein K444DRAFT_629594 [Hyaloscypha bicolor E]PMD60177.1 hypothetical protein K444DRAFT_629594 [Hyaloscypha bicolor E]
MPKLLNMQAGHEVTINTLVMNMYKLQYYFQLLGKNLPNPPLLANNFTDSTEITEFFLDAITNPDLQTAPYGIGALVKWGPSSFANAAAATARLMKIGVDGLTFESVNAGRMNGFTRAIQNRVHQATLTGFEILSSNKSIETQQRKIDLANQDITNQQQLIDNATEVLTLLKHNLKTLAAAYHDKRGYDFEITKRISIRQLDPPALFRLRELGTCEIIIPEVLYDMDFPGHYQIMIKSVSLSIPYVVDPYTSISCALRLLDSVYRTSSLATDKNAYPQDTTATTLY